MCGSLTVPSCSLTLSPACHLPNSSRISHFPSALCHCPATVISRLDYCLCLPPRGLPLAMLPSGLSQQGELSTSHTGPCHLQLRSLPWLTLVLRTEPRLLSQVRKALQELPPTSSSCQSKLTLVPHMCTGLHTRCPSALSPLPMALSCSSLSSWLSYPFHVGRLHVPYHVALHCNGLPDRLLPWHGSSLVSGLQLSARTVKTQHMQYLVMNE